MVKIKAKTRDENIVINDMIMLNNLLQMHLKLPQKEKFKKQREQLIIRLQKKIEELNHKVPKGLPHKQMKIKKNTKRTIQITEKNGTNY